MGYPTRDTAPYLSTLLGVYRPGIHGSLGGVVRAIMGAQDALPFGPN